jgi:hypothetical protein
MIVVIQQIVVKNQLSEVTMSKIVNKLSIIEIQNDFLL